MAFMSVPDLRNCMVDLLSESLAERPEKMRNRKHGFVSVLMKKDFEALQTISLQEVICEIMQKLPELLKFLVLLMLPPKKKLMKLGHL